MDNNSLAEPHGFTGRGRLRGRERESVPGAPAPGLLERPCLTYNNNWVNFYGTAQLLGTLSLAHTSQPMVFISTIIKTFILLAVISPRWENHSVHRAYSMSFGPIFTEFSHIICAHPVQILREKHE